MAVFSPNEAIKKNHNGLTFLQDKEGYREGDATSVCILLKARKTKKKDGGSCNLGTKICIAVTQTLGDCHRHRDLEQLLISTCSNFWHCTTGGHILGWYHLLASSLED